MFGPLVLLSLYWRRTTRNGALAGILTGALVALCWRLNTGGIFDVYELLPGFLASTLAIVAVSLCGTPVSRAADLCDSPGTRLSKESGENTGETTIAK